MEPEYSYYSVSDNPVPRGSARVGYRVQWNTKDLIVTLNKATQKIMDVEWNGASLVDHKRKQFQKTIQDADRSGSKTPVADLVKKLVNSGEIVKCI